MKIVAESACPSCHRLGVYARDADDRGWHCPNCNFGFSRSYKLDPTGKYIYLGSYARARNRAVAKIKRLVKAGEPPVFLTRGEKEALKHILRLNANKIQEAAKLTPTYYENDPNNPWRERYWNLENLARAIN